MRLPIGTALPLACWSTLAVAQQAPASTAYPPATEVLELLPPCAANCFAAVVPGSACSATDVRCMCTNQPLQDAAAECILRDCQSLMDALSAKNITSVACRAPVRDRSGQYVAVSIALGTMTIVTVVVRLVFKQFFAANRGLAADDKVILVTLALRISGTVLNVEGLAAHGLGRDTWTLPTHELTSFAEWLYVMEVLYLAELSLIKLSLSLFYVRIFPGATIRRLIWATAAVNALYGATFLVTAIFQCEPIDYFWTQYVEEHASGRCININAMGWANAAISVALDLWMISIPLSQIPKLKLHWTKKISVSVMFVLGAFVTVVSILRLSSLAAWANSRNPTWDQWNVVYWSTIEVNVGMVCTCLPSLRLLVVRALPGLTRSRSKPAAYGSNSFSRVTSGQPLAEEGSGTAPGDHRLGDFDEGARRTWTRIGSGAELWPTAR
ncbi:Extracellular membrane protein, CFEM domain protein [Metarhizium album ARSEF 1941]|uniref:Extracellular membrane protein, CFEM domain protein n=1 Tax=Metarhizium album (strain ARSEF 1941) TaxID=1081103 RepID=A0A0B2WIE2_METAS|nr:Extracellular membrane protein, CFEM domain protein [Metarhizium album ARSEF 1941]KHN95791.1 Extracellular membrane protein, CFEM domain protein [Metarhizium album ARSEF 1941]